MRTRYLGVIGGLLAFVSLALPWWVMNTSSSILGTPVSVQTDLYLYQVELTSLGSTMTTSTNAWYCTAALILVVIGGMLGLAGSVITPPVRGQRAVLGLGGLIVLLSVIIFAAGLQNHISNDSLETGASLFSSSSYLYFGFWVALVAAIMMFVALTHWIDESMPPLPPSSPSIPST